jgi:hypothetical protein
MVAYDQTGEIGRNTFRFYGQAHDMKQVLRPSSTHPHGPLNVRSPKTIAQPDLGYNERCIHPKKK